MPPSFYPYSSVRIEHWVQSALNTFIVLSHYSSPNVSFCLFINPSHSPTSIIGSYDKITTLHSVTKYTEYGMECSYPYFIQTPRILRSCLVAVSFLYDACRCTQCLISACMCRALASIYNQRGISYSYMHALYLPQIFISISCFVFCAARVIHVLTV